MAGSLWVLKSRGVGLLRVEPKLTLAMEVADPCLVMGHGKIVFEDTAEDLRRDTATRREWLEV